MDEIKDEFAKEFHKQLNDMREKSLFCDVLFNFPDEGKVIYAHRAVMASCCHYFRALFTSNMRESGQAIIEIPGICHADMETIVRYAYTRQVHIHSGNIENILCAADRLHVFGLVKVCCDFLRDNMSSDNALGIMKLADHFNCRRLAEQSRRFVMTNFSSVMTCSPEFQTLSADDLCAILQSDDLNFPDEDEAVDVISTWVSFDEESRKEYYPKLLSSIRLGLVHLKTYEDFLLSNKDILNSPECESLVRRGHKLSEINQKCRIPFLQGTSNPMLRPRVPNEIIYVLGGWCHDGVCGILETYDNRADRWYRNVKLNFEQNIAYHALVSIGQAIYVIGGYTATKYLNTTRKFDCLTKTWSEVAPMHTKRCYVCAAVMGGKIYACGGFDGYTRHNSAECYNRDNNQWILIASMKHVRSDAGACSVSGKIYVGGGFNGNECLDSVEVYDPAIDQWSDIDQLSSPRSGVVIVKYGKCVYVLGGFSGTRRLKTVERYDPKRGYWMSVPDMTTSRSNFTATVCDGLLFAIGGYDGSATTDKVECYDLYENQWAHSANLLTGRSATSACTVKHLRNVRDYTYYGREPKFICSSIRNYE